MTDLVTMMETQLGFQQAERKEAREEAERSEDRRAIRLRKDREEDRAEQLSIRAEERAEAQRIREETRIEAQRIREAEILEAQRIRVADILEVQRLREAEIAEAHRLRQEERVKEKASRDLERELEWKSWQKILLVQQQEQLSEREATSQRRLRLGLDLPKMASLTNKLILHLSYPTSGLLCKNVVYQSISERDNFPPHNLGTAKINGKDIYTM